MPVIKASAMPTGHLEGVGYEATTSLILDHSDPGDGPRLHKHPYDESWVVIEGTVIFQAGDQQLEAGPGDIVIVAADMPHKFTNCGTEQAYLVCIHANPTFETEWLE